MDALTKFKDLFGYGTTKAIGTSKMEVRVKGDLDTALKTARNIIEQHKLPLTAQTSGIISSYGAFDVTVK